MKKILSILQATSIMPIVSFSLVSCSKTMNSEVMKNLNYTDDSGNSKLEAIPTLKDDKFIFEIDKYDTIKSKVSSDDITDEKIKSFVEKTLKVTKKEEFKDVTEEFIDVKFDEIKVESNKIKFSKGLTKVKFKKGSSDLQTFKDIKIKDFEMEKADIEKFFNKITDQDFKHSDLVSKKIDENADFKSDSNAGKALKDFAKTIGKNLNIKVTTQDATAGTTLKITLDDLDAEKTIVVPVS